MDDAEKKEIEELFYRWFARFHRRHKDKKVRFREISEGHIIFGIERLMGRFSVSLEKIKSDMENDFNYHPHKFSDN